MNIQKIIKFSESDIKRDVLYHHKIREQIEFTFKYLFDNKRLPINKLKKDNTFNFSKLKFDEGKNYDWFFLVNDNSKILIRQYQSHFTFYTKSKIRQDQDEYFQKVCIFTIHFNRDKINDDDLSDSFCEDNFLGMNAILPNLIELLEKGHVHSLWNNLSFKREKYVDVEIAYTGGDDVSKLDVLLFACDELFSIYAEAFSKNEILDKLKTLKVGDKFGENSIILDVKTEVKDDYYHAVGLSYNETNFKGETEKKWADVYALSRWHYDELFYDELTNVVKEFAYKNYKEIFDELSTVEMYFFLFPTTLIKQLHAKFNETHEIEIQRFIGLLPKGFKNFIEELYRYTKESLK